MSEETTVQINGSDKFVCLNPSDNKWYLFQQSGGGPWKILDMKGYDSKEDAIESMTRASKDS